jgi:hypothetical protein
MDAQTAVPLYLTILMIVLCGIALIGGRLRDREHAEPQKDSSENP